MADIINFPPRSQPEARPALSIVPESTRSYVDRQLVYAGDSLAASLLEISGAKVLMTDGEPVGDRNSVFNGEALQSALDGIINLMNIRGAAEDDDLRRSVRAWLNRREAEHG